MRLPQDNNGRLKGFGYAEFADKEALLAALTLNNEVTFLAHETKFSGFFFLTTLYSWDCQRCSLSRQTLISLLVFRMGWKVNIAFLES